MSVTGRELRESLNGGSKSESSENLVLYGAIAGVILIAAIVFVTIGLMSTPAETLIADEDSAFEQVDTGSMNTASFAQNLSDSAEVLKDYNETLAKLRMCSYGKDRKKFESIITAYEKRNAAAVASWKPQKSKMYQKLEAGEAGDIEMMLYARGGGLQRDVMAELAMTDVALGTRVERQTPAQCMKLSGDVRMKKFDIEARK